MSENNENQLKIELKEDVAQGTYVNLAIISHSSSEFIIDFARIMPGLPKAGVKARMVMNPENAKRLLFTLRENVMKYEQTFGPIRMPEEKAARSQQKSGSGSTYIPNIKDFKSEE